MTRAANLAEAAGSGFAFRNRIINGAMMIDQRNAGASVTANNAYTLDRWQALNSQASKYTVQQNAGAVNPPAGFTKYLGVTSSSAYSVGSTDYFFVYQPIEGLNVTDLAWGTVNASAVTLSFKVYSSITGSFGGSIKNSNGSRSYPFSYTVSSANTWTSVSVTIPGDTTGTWATDNTNGIQVCFGLGSGSARLGTANTWAGANYDAPTGSVSVVGTNGATFYLTGVQLEKGTVATPFEVRPYGAELALCQRYYEKIGFGDVNSRYPTMANVATAASQQTYMSVAFAVPKRAIPTLTKGTAVLSNCTDQADGPSQTGFRYFITSSASGAYTSAFTNDGITASAEL